jgi:hypothetical protein
MKRFATALGFVTALTVGSAACAGHGQLSGAYARLHPTHPRSTIGVQQKPRPKSSQQSDSVGHVRDKYQGSRSPQKDR